MNKTKLINQLNGKLNLKFINNIAKDYTPPKMKGRKVDFNCFSNSLGSKTLSNISTPIGHISIDVKSQFNKMQYAKENRKNVLFNVKNTLKHPLVIAIGNNDSILFYGTYIKKNGKLFNMVSICGVADNKLVLKTSYQIRESKLADVIEKDNFLIYDISNPELNKILKNTLDISKGVEVTFLDRESEYCTKSFLSVGIQSYAVTTKEAGKIISNTISAIENLENKEVETVVAVENKKTIQQEASANQLSF